MFTRGVLLGDSFGPQVRGEEGVGLAEGVEDSHDEVTTSTGLTLGSGVDVFNTSHLDDSGGDGSGDDTGTLGGGDQADGDGTRLAGDLHGDGVRSTEHVTPVTTADGGDVELGGDDGGADGGGDFLTGTRTNTDVTVTITNADVDLEAGALTGRRNLLDGLDLHDFVLHVFSLDEGVDDLGLLDGHGEEEDVFEGFNLTFLDEATELGAGNPVFLVVLTGTRVLLLLAALLVVALLTETLTFGLLGGLLLGSSVSHDDFVLSSNSFFVFKKIFFLFQKNTFFVVVVEQ